MGRPKRRESRSVFFPDHMREKIARLITRSTVSQQMKCIQCCERYAVMVTLQAVFQDFRRTAKPMFGTGAKRLFERQTK